MTHVYSHSRLACFEDCAKRFRYRYLLKIPAKSESIEAFVGKRVHEVLERLHQFVATDRIPSLDRVLYRFRRLWEERYDPDRVRIVREGFETAFYVELGERCLRNHYRTHYPFDEDETLGLERPVRVALDEGRGYWIRGVIDRLVRARDGAVEIHDYKTGQRIPSQKKLDEDRQLGLYQLGVAEEHGAGTPIRLVWHYLAFGETRTSTRTPEQLEGLRRRTVELIERVESEERFEARPGPLCAWCEYRDICPESAAPPYRTADPDRAETAPGPQLELL